MPRKDFDHDTVREALTRDGWNITHDPYMLEYGGRNLYVDLGAESGALAAEKAGLKIAVEVKGFLAASDIAEWERALGQFVFYRFLIGKQEPDRVLYLAMRQEAYDRLFQDPRGIEFIETQNIFLLLWDHTKNEVVRWIP